jgi:hypothetical protein
MVTGKEQLNHPSTSLANMSSEGGTTEESLHENLIKLTKYHWLANERFFASLRMTMAYRLAISG